MGRLAALPPDIGLTRTVRSPLENAPGDARLVDSAGKVYAHGTQIRMIFPKEGPDA
jgi:hypothetical protein